VTERPPREPPSGGTSAAGRQALALYATDDAYALAALVLVEQVRRLGLDPSIEVVLLHRWISSRFRKAFEDRGVRLLRVRPLRYVGRGYYRDCLIKLHVLGLTDYERVVFLDADGLLLRSPQPLFDLPLERAIAAPRAYWLPDRLVTTMLLVVRPDRRLFDLAATRFPTARKRGEYDMDIVHFALADRLQVLPEGLACLDSELEHRDGPFAFGDPEETFERLIYVHFTAVGKPWACRTDRLRELRPEAHPLFFELRDAWWAVRDEVWPRERAGRQAVGERATAPPTRSDSGG
jgi:hypothetical protein